MFWNCWTEVDHTIDVLDIIDLPNGDCSFYTLAWWLPATETENNTGFLPSSQRKGFQFLMLHCEMSHSKIKCRMCFLFYGQKSTCQEMYFRISPRDVRGTASQTSTGPNYHVSTIMSAPEWPVLWLIAEWVTYPNVQREKNSCGEVSLGGKGYMRLFPAGR